MFICYNWKIIPGYASFKVNAETSVQGGTSSNPAHISHDDFNAQQEKTGLMVFVKILVLNQGNI